MQVGIHPFKKLQSGPPLTKDNSPTVKDIIFLLTLMTVLIEFAAALDLTSKIRSTLT